MANLNGIKQNFDEDGPNKVEKGPNMERVAAINDAAANLHLAMKEYNPSSLTDAEADILIRRLTHEFEEYLQTLLDKREAAFKRRKERPNV